MSRFGSLGTQYFDDAGDPLVSGKIYVYEPGTNTAKNTYADVNLTVPNTNPVILSASGRQPDIFFTGSARVILTDSDSVQIEVRDPVGGDVTDSAFSDWNSETIYNVPDIVVGSDNNYYVSIIDNNQGNNPTSTPSSWTQVQFIRVWNTNETYSAGTIVKGSDGLLYSAVTSSNLGNNPTLDATNWKGAAGATIDPVIRAASKTYAYNNF